MRSSYRSDATISCPPNHIDEANVVTDSERRWIEVVSLEEGVAALPSVGIVLDTLSRLTRDWTIG